MTQKNASGFNNPVNESQGGTDATTFAQARLNMSLAHLFNGQPGNYLAVATDLNKFIHFTGAGPYTLTLTPAGTLGNQWQTVVRNDTAANLTIDPNGGELINGAATLTLEVGQAITITCDATGFYTAGEATIAGGGANKSLSNLTNPTSVNQDLIPSAAGKFLGDLSAPWAGLFTIGTLAAQAGGSENAMAAYDGILANYKNFFTVTSGNPGNAATGVIDSSVTATTQAPATNTTQVATTAFVQAAIGGSGFVPTSRTITVAGTANEITSSAGAQDLSANRTWTLSLPAALTFTGKTITGGAYSGASATTFTFTTGSIGTAVTAVTQAASDNSTKLATTAYVDSAVSTAVPNPLTLAKGGTNANLTASNGGIFYSTAGAGAILAGTATARQMLQSGASGAPAWSTATYPATTTINRILYSSAANVVGEIATANSSVLVTDGAGVPSLSTTLPNGILATTQAALDNSTKVATTAYVDSAVTAATISPFIGIAGTTQAAAINKGYYTTNVALTTITLPSVAAAGSVVAVAGGGTGGWKVAQNAGQLINFGAVVTTTGVTGSLASTLTYDAVELVCVVANTTWMVRNSMGNITYV